VVDQPVSGILGLVLEMKKILDSNSTVNALSVHFYNPAGVKPFVKGL